MTACQNITEILPAQISANCCLWSEKWKNIQVTALHLYFICIFSHSTVAVAPGTAVGPLLCWNITTNIGWTAMKHSFICDQRMNPDGFASKITSRSSTVKLKLVQTFMVPRVYIWMTLVILRFSVRCHNLIWNYWHSTLYFLYLITYWHFANVCMPTRQTKMSKLVNVTPASHLCTLLLAFSTAALKSSLTELLAWTLSLVHQLLIWW